MATFRSQVETLLRQYAENQHGEDFYMAVTSLCAQKVEAKRPPCRIKFNRETVMWEGITRGDLARWTDAFPAVDIEQQLKAMKVWIMNAGANGHKTQWGAFIARWLTKEQNRGGARR